MVMLRGCWGCLGGCCAEKGAEMGAGCRVIGAVAGY